VTVELAARHDAYAADYDEQVRAYGAYLTEVLFGLVYEWATPGQRLLDLGIGTGLSAALFAKAGLNVYGMDFSPAMLDLCRAKGTTVDLRQQDLQQIPWPYPGESFDHAVCCGVFHFIGALDTLFGETDRVLRPGGLFAFTTKDPLTAPAEDLPFERTVSDGLVVYNHSPTYIDALIQDRRLDRMKVMRCFVGEDIFSAWVVQKQS
jgi:predicted TPR repeat methyltransferase